MDKMQSDIIDYLSKNKQAAHVKQIGDALNLSKTARKNANDAIAQLEQAGKIMITKQGKVVLAKSQGFVGGPFCATDKGYGFVVSDDLGSDLFVASRFFNGAMHGDIVLAKITKPAASNRKAEGEIVRVIKRNTGEVIGKFENNKSFGYVVADQKNIAQDIYIPKKYMMGAKNHQKVVVKITKFSEGKKSHEGRVVKILGSNNSKDANYMSVLYQHGIKTEFPKQVLAEALEIAQTVGPKECRGRLDLRGQIVFTIDGADAKDFDDAVSIEKLENENFLLGVHIADVSHYVRIHSAIEQEAFHRGTSLYFVDQVVPMLPEVLSNGICSLNPHVDRLTLSCMMEIDKTGQVITYQIKESVINSCERLIYRDVTAVLEHKDKELEQRYSHLKEKFEQMAQLASILHQKRVNRGCLDFDFPEAKILLDQSGKPVKIVKRERGLSDNIIEEFMLAANETVAQHVYEQKLPLVYRIHEAPSDAKAESFLRLLGLLGYQAPKNNKLSSQALQKILEQVKGKKEERMLATAMLRSLMKAQYSHENLGHFGLAAKYYCHFTSPIRRYPDLVVHRVLKDMIHHKLKGGILEQMKQTVVTSAKQATQTEINAVETEREIEDLYKVIYMKQFVGQEFKAIISSVTSFGLFIELDNTIEGLVSMTSLDDDYYIYNELNFCLTGQRTNNTYKLGDLVSVKLIRADVSTRELDFLLLKKLEN